MAAPTALQSTEPIPKECHGEVDGVSKNGPTSLDSLSSPTQLVATSDTVSDAPPYTAESVLTSFDSSLSTAEPIEGVQVASALQALLVMEAFYTQGIFYERDSQENKDNIRILGELISSIRKKTKVLYSTLILTLCPPFHFKSLFVNTNYTEGY